MLQIRLPNGEEDQSKGNVTLEANIKKCQVTFKAHVLDIMLLLLLGVDFLEHVEVALDYANGKTTISMIGCRYPLCLC